MAVKMAGKVAGKVAGKILKAMRQNPTITIPELTVQIMVSQRSIERNIKRLQESGRLRRVGPSRGGHWEVLS
jgi:predicted HTH transcriptional regulator